MEIQKNHRIESLDLLRGLVIILMGLDHSRQFLGYGSFLADPTNLLSTTPLLFFTRWITHFCAPVFVFLAGTSAFLYGERLKNTSRLSRFLLTRGLWLLLLEATVIRFGWTFDVTFSLCIMQIIWVIGVGMIFLAALVHLPKWSIFAIGIIMVAGHDLFSGIQVEGRSLTNILWYLLHQQHVILTSTKSAICVYYPLLPWLGVIALGYVFGSLYQQNFAPAKRRKWLLWMGCVAILLFVALRAFNLYGEPSHWSRQASLMFSIMAFLNTTKFPASLQFLLMTLGPAFLFLAVTDTAQSRVTRIISTFGRVPLFFYVVHIYVLHLAAVVGLLIDGVSWQQITLFAGNCLNHDPIFQGFSLGVVYLVWIGVMAALYPLCKWYAGFKSRHHSSWWIRYI